MAITKRILVADDEPSVRRLFEIGLRDVGLEVVTAKTGLEAIEKLKKEFFDLFISDLRMPGIDGLTTIEKVRAFNSQIPIILQGSFKSEESAQRAVALKVDDYLVKPYEWISMLEVIFRILGNHG